MREFARGVGTLITGFRWWGRRPGIMALGLIPAAIVGIVAIGAIIALAISLPALTVAVTPFADGWPEGWAVLLRIVIGTAMLAGALLITAMTFTALTLAVGDPFYERIWRAVEASHGEVPAEPYGFWRAVRDGVRLVVRGIGAAILTALIGLIPVVGAACAAVAGVLLGGWLLADELTSRALTARGLDRKQRRPVIRAHRARALGFGVATQLCFLVPLGAVVAMPAAVAGATEWVHGALTDDAGR